jgi:hypothetical protein
VAVLGRGWDPSPIPYAPEVVQTRITLIENDEGFLFLHPFVPLSLFPFVPFSLFPSEQGCEAAQFCNEDRIKISVETVQLPLTITKDVASGSTLHRIARILSVIEQLQFPELLPIINSMSGFSCCRCSSLLTAAKATC